MFTRMTCLICSTPSWFWAPTHSLRSMRALYKCFLSLGGGVNYSATHVPVVILCLMTSLYSTRIIICHLRKSRTLTERNRTRDAYCRSKHIMKLVHNTHTTDGWVDNLIWHYSHPATREQAPFSAHPSCTSTTPPQFVSFSPNGNHPWLTESPQVAQWHRAALNSDYDNTSSLNDVQRC